MDYPEYTELLKNYENASIKICIEKCCNYRFIFFLDKDATLSDMYNYVISFYSHVTDPILLYIDSEHKILVPNNKIPFKNYVTHNKILSTTLLNVPTVYKFYLDLCSKHKNSII